MRNSFSLTLCGVFVANMAVAAVAMAQQVSSQPVPEPAAATWHRAKASAIAGNDADLQKWVSEGPLCRAPRSVQPWTSPGPTAHVPVKMFDNLYMVGSEYVGAYILKTSDGLIMWDTMNTPDDARNIIEPGMRQLGLDPVDIKYIILTHAHSDHWGGARYFQDKYHVPIAAVQEDWDWMYADSRPNLPERPRRDQVLTDGQDLKFGNAVIRIVKTPGHTPGVASSLFPVLDKGVVRHVVMLGGTAYESADTQFKLAQMHNSLHKLWYEAQKYRAEVYINTPHVTVFQLDDKFARLGKQSTNPLVIGEEGVNRSMEILDQCIEGQWAWYAAINKQ